MPDILQVMYRPTDGQLEPQQSAGPRVEDGGAGALQFREKGRH